MDLRHFAYCLMLAIISVYSSVQADVLKTINVSLPTDYGLFLGEIHYSEKDLVIARRVERIMREDLIKVINYFEYVPIDVVHFNIDPNLRLTNGSARNFPTNIINLYNFPASGNEHLIVLENWLQGLVLHEFVHITHLDQTRDYLKIGRKIFGTIAKAPTGIVPHWFSEGIAVWGESHLIDGGRLNNQLLNKDLLIQFKNENYCQSIDCLDSPGAYPNGQMAYWAGAHFINYLENIKPKTIKCLVEYNSGAIPFFLNNAFLECTGEKAQDLFIKFRKDFLKNEITQTLGNPEDMKKVNNAFGSDDFQKGFVLDGQRLFKVEQKKYREALVSYDLQNETHLVNQLDAPIANVYTMVDQGNENKFLLVAFNDDLSNRMNNKVWKLINPKTLKVEHDLNFSHDPSYVIPLDGGDHYLTFSYWDNRWIVESNAELLRSFPSQYSLNFVKKMGDKLLLKVNDGEGKSLLIISDLRLQKLNVVYKSEKYYDLPLVADNYLIIREKNQLKLLEFDQEVYLSQLPENFLNGLANVEVNKSRILLLENGLISSAKESIHLEDQIKSKKLDTVLVREDNWQISADTEDPNHQNKQENYPRLDHMIPHYWFLAGGNADNLNTIGAMTTFVDPMEINFLNATALAYPEIKKVGGTLDYYQKIIGISDLLSVTALINQDYSKTDFNSTVSRSSEYKIRTSYKFLFKQWVYFPGIFIGQAKTEDFLSNRNVVNTGISHTLTYQALTTDSFFQYFTGRSDLQVNKPSGSESYLVNLWQAEGGWQLNPELSGLLKGSYSRLFKSDFTRGVVYAGGVTDYTKTRVHEFYGLPYSNAYGNEIFTGRLLFDYNFWDIYRGKNLIPFFLKEIHLLAGAETIYANRIILDGNTLRNRGINDLFIGPRLKVNLFYAIPSNIDLIFSKVENPNGKSINKVNFTFVADLFQ